MQTASAQERRPIDPQHPAWMIHVDVWNNADPQKIINLIPADIKPYVIINLSLSCSYDKELDMHQKPQNALQTYRSWASICCANNLWFTCQPASGGHTHIQDDAEHFQQALEIHESFFKDYKNFLGWNYAEQFWGFNEQGDKYSSKDVDRIKLFAELVPMHHKYGGFLTISFCGNIWSHPLNPVGMMRRNTTFLRACHDNPEAILFLYKYTTSASWFNNESVTLAPFVSGLAKNYGVRYDNCGWNGAIDEICKNDGLKHTYPGAVGIAPVLEQMCLNGACVWDGPELIWTEDFKETSATTTSAGYRRRNWTTYPTFDKIWVDMFRKVLDGTIHIASREEVIERTKVVMINDVRPSDDQTSLKINAYASPLDLYHGLYLQDDPLNARSHYESGLGTINGTGNDQMLYFKKTGRYQAIPIVISLYDDLAKSIPVQIKRSDYNAKKGDWQTRESKVAKFNSVYPEVSQGDMFVARHHNELVCYTPYSYLNTHRESNAEIPLQYNTCKTLKMKFSLFSNALVKEYDDHIYFYLNNYRSDTLTAMTDIIVIEGATAKPTATLVKRASAAALGTETWDEATGTYTYNLRHNGPVDLTINCAGNETDRLTDVLADEKLTDLPPTPELTALLQEIIVEAEDMDTKDVQSIVTDAYNSQYRNLRGHSAMGFVVMGTKTSGSLQAFPNIKATGSYDMTVKYRTNDNTASAFTLKNNVTSKVLSLPGTAGEWKTATVPLTFKKGSTTLTLTNTGGKDFMFDQLVITPGEALLAIDKVLTGEDADAEVSSMYSLSGLRVAQLQKGVNIIKLSNGKTKKVYVK